MFCSPAVREGILPRMLSEILDTRVMVKTWMKRSKDNPVLHRILNSRQMGLKMIANVTYGYTSASFSGRMPCVDIADAIVSTGRKALEQAVHLIESTPEWNAQVEYGDTDRLLCFSAFMREPHTVVNSVFVRVRGATLERAFEVGRQIAARVTAMNPLQLEKVYLPAIMVSKKRYFA